MKFTLKSKELRLNLWSYLWQHARICLCTFKPSLGSLMAFKDDSDIWRIFAWSNLSILSLRNISGLLTLICGNCLDLYKFLFTIFSYLNTPLNTKLYCNVPASKDRKRICRICGAWIFSARLVRLRRDF